MNRQTGRSIFTVRLAAITGVGFERGAGELGIMLRHEFLKGNFPSTIGSGLSVYNHDFDDNDDSDYHSGIGLNFQIDTRFNTAGRYSPYLASVSNINIHDSFFGIVLGYHFRKVKNW